MTGTVVFLNIIYYNSIIMSTSKKNVYLCSLCGNKKKGHICKLPFSFDPAQVTFRQCEQAQKLELTITINLNNIKEYYKGKEAIEMCKKIILAQDDKKVEPCNPELDNDISSFLHPTLLDEALKEML